jgi:hypothetical protein
VSAPATLLFLDRLSTSTLDHMKLAFSRPAGFTDRVFLVRAEFDAPSFPGLVGFDVPEVPHWYFRPTNRPEFHQAPLADTASPFRALIVNGEWEFIVQSNGYSVAENPTSLDQLKSILTALISSATSRYEHED